MFETRVGIQVAQGSVESVRTEAEKIGLQETRTVTIGTFYHIDGTIRWGKMRRLRRIPGVDNVTKEGRVRGATQKRVR